MAVAFDAVTVGKSAGTTSLSFSHTCTGADRVLFVSTNNRDAGAGDVTGVTYNGVAMTQISTSIANGSSKWRVWRLIAPATGANNVVVSISGSRPIIAIAMSVTGADQTDPDGTVAESATTLSTSVAGVDSGNLTASFGFSEDSATPAPPEFSPTGSATHTERADDAQGFQYSCAGTQDATGTVTASYSYEAGLADGFGIIAFEVIAAGASSGGPRGGVIPEGMERDSASGLIIPNNTRRLIVPVAQLPEHMRRAA